MPSQCSMVLVPGPYSFSFAIINEETSELIEYVHFRNSEEENRIDQLVSAHPVVLDNFKKKRIVFDTPEFILIPSSLYQFDQAGFQLDIIFGADPDTKIYAESVSFLNLVIVYRVCEQLLTQLQHKFSTAEFSHAVICSLKNFEAGEDVIRVFFKTEAFSVQVWKNNSLHFIQQFTYQSTEDILYYLFAICRAFNISQEETGLMISGLVDKDSALCKELNKYFIHISFEEPGARLMLPDVFQQYPPHYFSPIINMVTCA